MMRRIFGAVLTFGVMALTAALVIGLVVQTIRAHRENERQLHRAESLERHVERLRDENASLRNETRALKEDPAYIENRMRQSSKMSGEGEKLLVK